MTDLKHIPGLQGAGREKALPYPRWIEVAIVVGFFVGLFLLRLAQSEELLFGAIFWGGYYLPYIGITFLLFKFCRVLHADEVGWGTVILGHTILFFLVTVASEKIIEAGHHVLFQWTNLSFQGDPYTYPDVIRNVTYIDQIGNYTIPLLGGLARDFFLRHTAKQARNHKLKQKAQQLQNRLTTARLDALRMQINPHFLFNTLHVINTMAGSNPEGVRRATKRLGGLLRYALSSDEQEVAVSRELQFLRGYLEIQKLRLQDQLRVEIEADTDVQNALMPTLLLQPLAENAVKHGVQHVEGTGRIRIRIFRRNRDLIVRVEDNGPGVAGEPLADGAVGLENIHERLAQLYGDDASLALSDSDLGGCRAEVRLPYHTNQDPSFEAVVEMDDSRTSVS